MLEILALHEGIDPPVRRLDRICSGFPGIGWPAAAGRNCSGERGDLRRDGTEFVPAGRGTTEKYRARRADSKSAGRY